MDSTEATEALTQFAEDMGATVEWTTMPDISNRVIKMSPDELLRIINWAICFRGIEPVPDIERYRWLRDGASRFVADAPFVSNPKMVKPFGVGRLASENLDSEVDEDIIKNKMYELHQEGYISKKGLLPQPIDFFSEEYKAVLIKEAGRALKWPDGRVESVKKNVL